MTFITLEISNTYERRKTVASKKNINPLAKKKITKVQLKENVQLLILFIPAFVLTAIFAYWPMFGIILPFKNYSVKRGFWGSDWADPWWKNFRLLFLTPSASRLLRNTIGMNLLFITVGLFCSVGFALLLFEVKKAMHVKVYQTFAILPNFLSWVAVSYIVYAVLETRNGILNRFLISLGGEGVAWYFEPSYWPVILLIVSNWHGVGINCIIYYASLMGIDTELFEAAEIDGATKGQKTWYISIPHLTSIVTILTIMSIGGIFSGDFGLFYNVTRNITALYPTTDIINTFTFRALISEGNVAISSATGLLQSAAGFVMLMIVNTIVRKVSPENALF